MTHMRMLLQLLRLVAPHNLSMFSWSFSVSAETCEQIAQVRRKLQRIGTSHILFLDETHKREGDVESILLSCQASLPISRPPPPPPMPDAST